MSNTEDIDKYWAKVIGLAKVALVGASDSLLRIQLFDVLEEFFSESNCWEESIKFVVVPDTLDYPIYPTSGRILRLDSVIDQNNVPQAAVMPVIGQIRFFYPYSNTQPMTANVVKNVSDPFDCFPPHIPEWVLPLHGRVILHGLIGKMMIQMGQSWSNPTIGNFHMSKFSDGMSGAWVAASKMNTIGAQAWAFPQQFRVSGQRGGVSTFALPTPR